MSPVLEARKLSRRFGHVVALDGADLDVEAGEVVALIGDNGAGKSTLVKAISGNVDLDSGSVLVGGDEVVIDSPHAASQLGIEVVYQDLALAPHLGATQNMFLGRELPQKGLRGRMGFLRTKEMHRQARESFDDLNVRVRSLNAPVGRMSGGQRQAIAIARAVAWTNRILFLDEPTAALGVVQTRNVLDLIKRVRDKGTAVVLISHSLPDVMAVADRIQVLRLGRRVETFQASKTSMDELVGAMTGTFEGAA